ncbi:MAG: OsmC family protein [Bacteroidetes bacterium]|nr:OsmC family protein [Bacteroidota bacterium]
MTAQIIYLGDLRTQATHLQSQTIIDTDAPKDNQGKGERFSPTDLVATALGSCMLSIMGIAANTHSMDIVETSVDIEKIMVADPFRRIGEIKVDIHFPSTKTYTDKEKKILERAALTCPVYLSLNENVQKTVTFNWP